MKFNIEADVTPEELRKLMGWPDVEKFQQEMFEQIRAQMKSGAEGYDPLSLMRPFLTQSLQSMDLLQKVMGGAMRGYTGQTKKGSEE